MPKRRPQKAAPSRDLLVDAREKSGKSQTDIADEFGITQAAISKWESGAATPHPSQWNIVADAYGLSFSKVCELFGAKAAS